MLTETAFNAAYHPIIDYFSGTGTDGNGRTLSRVICQSDEWLEETHDFIQWLFPLSEKSRFEPTAPLIDGSVIHAFNKHDALRANLLLAYDRMLSFYGLRRHGTVVVRGENWAQRSSNWYNYPTHNDLRITRILKSLTLLGLGEYAASSWMRSWTWSTKRIAALPALGSTTGLKLSPGSKPILLPCYADTPAVESGGHDSGGAGNSTYNALVGFRRMPRQRQRVVGVVVAIHVGDLECGFEDGCFDGHVRIDVMGILQARILA